MTLEELNNQCFSMPGHLEPSRLYVFTDKDNADNWIDGGRSSELTMVLQSSMVTDYTLKKEWCKAEVQYFHAVGENELVVVIEEPKRKRDRQEVRDKE